MKLDRRPGMFFDVTLQAAFRRAQASADQAQGLLDAGYPEPAYVWAFRSLEIFVKEVMLLPLFLEEIPEGDFDEVWAEARRRIEDTFKSGRWDNALKRVNEVYGPLDPMVTDDGRDVWQVWKSVALPRRGDIVHGRPLAVEVTADEAAELLQWSSQMRGQLSMRLVVARKHPVSDLVIAAFEKPQAQFKAESDPPGGGTQGVPT